MGTSVRTSSRKDKDNTMALIQNLIILAFFIQLGSALKCYKCMNGEDCAESSPKNGEEVECGEGKNACVKYTQGDLSTGDCYAMSANETEECVEMKEGIAGAIGQMGSALAGLAGQEAP